MINLKRKLKILMPLFVLVLMLTSISCTTARVNVRYNLKGHTIDSPVDIDALRKSIKFSLSEYSWKIVNSDEEVITASYSKDGLKILAEIEIIITGDSYSIHYIDKPGRGIPGRYNNWVRNLNKRIQTNYYRM